VRFDLAGPLGLHQTHQGAEAVLDRAWPASFCAESLAAQGGEQDQRYWQALSHGGIIHLCRDGLSVRLFE
jgi:hypothetical protein